MRHPDYRFKANWVGEALSSNRQDIAAVVIGRNEGERLELSLLSVRAAGLPLVYVDSGSSDGSSDVARAIGVAVVELDPSAPFSAGRGRKIGRAHV